MMARPHYIDGGLGIGVIGCGSIGSLRAEIASRHPSIRHLAVCDVLEERARAVADFTGAEACYRDHLELVNDEKVDGVIVASTEDAHVAPTLAAIQAGKPVLVEKPLALLSRRPASGGSPSTSVTLSGSGAGISPPSSTWRTGFWATSPA
jgi:hypothetical protein